MGHHLQQQKLEKQQHQLHQQQLQQQQQQLQQQQQQRTLAANKKQPVVSKVKKTKKGTPNVFGGPAMSLEMEEWCKEQLTVLCGSPDITLAHYLMTIDSPSQIG